MQGRNLSNIVSCTISDLKSEGDELSWGLFEDVGNNKMGIQFDLKSCKRIPTDSPQELETSALQPEGTEFYRQLNANTWISAL